MNEFVERSGTVISVHADVVRLRLAAAPSCAGCGSRDRCASGSASARIVELRQPNPPAPGTEVRLVLPESSVLLAALLGYLLPVVGLLLGGVVTFACHASDLSAVAGAAAGFAAGLLGIRRLSGGVLRSALTPTACRLSSLSPTGEPS